MDILQHWSHSNSPPRETQLRALEWLEKQTARYLILEIPVGGGKSHLGVTYGNSIQSDDFRKSFILTPQKVLQEQYENTFPEERVFAFYGKNNYTCSQRNTTCDIGSLIKPECESCPFVMAKGRAKNVPHVVLNYTMALLCFNYTNMFKRRPLMILDECHNTEQQLTELNALQITAKRAERMGVKWKVLETLDHTHKWLNDVYHPAVEIKLTELVDECSYIIDSPSSRQTTSVELNKLKELASLQEHEKLVRTVMNERIDDVKQIYTLVHDKTMIKFKYLFASTNFYKILEPMADKFLFMSSTILNYKGFCNDLGISQDEAAFLSLPSEFPVENRPVYFMPSMRMNVNWKDPQNQANRKAMIGTIKGLLELHNDVSGIIHTGSFAIAQWLIDELSNSVPHVIFEHNPSEQRRDRRDVIDDFKHSSKPGVLISPSITEGLDLVNDLARFAIFVKVPYGFLGDQWIKARMELSGEWYQRQALVDMIQGGGRIVRSKEDWGHVYILDSSWSYLYSKASHMIPKWWKQAYTEV
jgi:Rad3-related DNA helicase